MRFRLATERGHGVPAEMEATAEKVVGACLDVHRALGPGLLESVYRDCLVLAVEDAGCRVATEVPVPVTFRGRAARHPLRLDLLVDDCLLVELKAVEKVTPLHQAQLLTYLRLSNRSLGLLVNFNVTYVRDGIQRVVRTRGI